MLETLLALSLHALATSNVVTVKLPLDGRTTSVSVPPHARKVVFEGRSAGNLTSVVDLDLTAPDGASVNVFAGKVVRGKVRRPYELQIEGEEKLSDRERECLPISVESGSEEPKDDELDVKDFPEMTHEICDLLPPGELERLADRFTDTYEEKWSAGNVCAYIVYFVQSLDGDLSVLFPMSEPEAKTMRARVGGGRVLFRKDACDRRVRSYLFRVEVDLSKVEMGEGTSVSLRARERKLKRGKPAAIKPESDGRYKPKPLIMMDWLGSTCGNRVDVTRWKRDRPLSSVSLPPYALLSYKGLVLNLVLADKVMTGGKGVAELSDGDSAYGVCFDLERRRQNKNGYPR